MDSRRPPAPLPAQAPRGRGKVLLVEDDELVRESVSGVLADAGFEIHAVATADEALARMDGGESFDVVFTDVVMPGTLDGIALARHIRERHPATGVVIASGYADRHVLVPGVRTLPKPYDLDAAVAALDDALPR